MKNLFTCILYASTLTALFQLKAIEKGVLYEQWNGIGGYKVQDLLNSERYKTKQPSVAFITEQFRKYNTGDKYGARFTSILTPEKSGKYVFYISSDDSSELFLSTDDSQDKLRKIAFVKGYTDINYWKAQPGQRSKPIPLEAGKHYRLMALMKDEGGDDHLEVAWKIPGSSRVAYIPPECLAVPDIKDSAFRKKVMKFTAVRKEADRILRHITELPPGELEKYADSLSPRTRTAVTRKLSKIETLFRAYPKIVDMKLLKALCRKAEEILPSRKHKITNPVLITLLFIESAYLHSLSYDDIKAYGAHGAAAAMGKIPSNALPGKHTAYITSAPAKGRREQICLGLYALPGKTVTVNVPKSLTDKKLVLQIGHHLDDSGNYRKVKSFHSMPYTTWKRPITSETTELTNPYGGLIFIIVPRKIGIQYAKIEVNGAVRAPRFVLGQTTDEAWRKIREYPAPWGELVSDRIIFLAPSYLLREIDNPTALMQWWKNNVATHEEFYNYNIKVPMRVHVSYYPIRGCATWPLYETDETMRDNFNLESLKTFNNALFLHEHGHHADDSRMFFQNIGETTPNWGGYYVKGTKGDFVWSDTEEMHMLNLFSSEFNKIKKDKWWTKKGPYYWSYPITTIMLGYVQGFGWNAFKAVVHRFTDKDDSVYKLPFCNGPGRAGIDYGQNNSSKLKKKNQMMFDKWLIMMSEEANYDITPYMAHFYITPSPACRKYIDSKQYRKWDLVYCPERPVVGLPNKPLTLKSPEKYALTMEGPLKFKWTGKPVHGHMNDEFTYIPEKGFAGEDFIPFSLTDSYGNVLNRKMKIIIVPKHRQPQFSAGRVENVTPGKWTKVAFPDILRTPVITASMDSAEKKFRKSYAVRIRNLSHSGFEVTLQPRSDKVKKVIPLDITWFVMEAGRYTESKSGIRGEAGIFTMRPQRPAEKMPTKIISMDNHRQSLRDSTFGQVLTSNNPEWSAFYGDNDFKTRGKKVGIYGTAKSFESSETAGYQFLKYGLYQFDATELKIMRGSIIFGNIRVKLHSPTVSEIQRMAKQFRH